MKLTVIIAEYNPLHNGHVYHLEQAKKLGNPIIVLMSGPFVQRGEPSIFDKYDRAKCAIENGADVVFEIPAPFSFAPADKYALGSFKMIEAINGEITLSFGSECGDIDKINNTAKLLIDNPKEYVDMLKYNLSQGYSYVKAQADALNEYATSREIEIADITKPNNILAIEYAKRNLTANKPCKTVTHQRLGDYNGKDGLSFYSATAIRSMIENGEAIPKNSIPRATAELIENVKYTNNDILYIAAAVDAGMGRIKCAYDVGEGLENRIERLARDSINYEDFLDKCVTKRYTRSRIQRIMTNILLEVTNSSFAVAVNEPPVFNLLAIKDSSRSLLSNIEQNVITSQSALSRDPRVQAKIMSKAQVFYKFLRGYAKDCAIVVK